MRGRFVGNPANGGEGPSEITYFGVTFPKDEWIAVNPVVASQLAHNTHFEFETEAEAAEAEVVVEEPKRGKKAKSAPESEVAADEAVIEAED